MILIRTNHPYLRMGHHNRLDLPRSDLAGITDRFIEEEVWSVIKALPPDKAPNLDGFTARFLQVAWLVIRYEVLMTLLPRGFHNINEVLMTLLPKYAEAKGIRDYWPISLIRSVGKLFSKVLTNILAPNLNSLVHIS
jgi:hypothetical protein